MGKTYPFNLAPHRKLNERPPESFKTTLQMAYHPDRHHPGDSPARVLSGKKRKLPRALETGRGIGKEMSMISELIIILLGAQMILVLYLTNNHDKRIIELEDKKMKESPHVTHEEEVKQSTIKCFIAAFVIVIGGLCLLVYGLALFQHENITTERIGMVEKRIESLSVKYENHIHRYSDGKIK